MQCQPSLNNRKLSNVILKAKAKHSTVFKVIWNGSGSIMLSHEFVFVKDNKEIKVAPRLAILVEPGLKSLMADSFKLNIHSTNYRVCITYHSYSQGPPISGLLLRVFIVMNSNVYTIT